MHEARDKAGRILFYHQDVAATSSSRRRQWKTTKQWTRTLSPSRGHGPLEEKQTSSVAVTGGRLTPRVPLGTGLYGSISCASAFTGPSLDWLLVDCAHIIYTTTIGLWHALSMNWRVGYKLWSTDTLDTAMSVYESIDNPMHGNYSFRFKKKATCQYATKMSSTRELAKPSQRPLLTLTLITGAHSLYLLDWPWQCIGSRPQDLGATSPSLPSSPPPLERNFLPNCVCSPPILPPCWNVARIIFFKVKQCKVWLSM
jgi:hypothetical protein